MGRFESSLKTAKEDASTADRHAANVARNQLHIHDISRFPISLVRVAF